MESVSLYSEAKNEYLKQLASWIVPPLVEFFRKEYSTIAEKEGKKSMTAFQIWCSEIPRWNQDVIDTNIAIILDNCRCDYVEELMTAVFIAHTKMLTAIRVSTKKKKLQITLPKLDHFLHRIFVECARTFWKAPFLFSEDLSPIEKQKNVLQVEAMCTEALASAVRSLLPVKSILRDYLDDDDEEDEEEPVVQKEEKKQKKRKEPEPEPELESDSESDIQSDDEHESTIPEPEKQDSVSVKEVVPEPVKQVQPESTIKSEPFKQIQSESAIESESIQQVQSEPVIESESIQQVQSNPTTEFESIKEVQSEPVIEFEPVQQLQSEPVKEVVSENKKGYTVLVKEDAPTLTKDHSVMQELAIDTEPTVHFTPYDTVYDENTPDISEMRYVPKMSVEELDDYIPRIQINSNEESLSLDDMEDLTPSNPSTVNEEIVEEDVDIPLAQSSDFEEL